MRDLLLVAAGGAVGSSLRYALTLAAARGLPSAFPWGTLLVNTAGSFAIGALMAVAGSRGGPSPEVRLLLVTGVLGGFTTFSAYSFETLALARSGQVGAALAYAGGSVALGLAAAWCGHAMLRG